MNRRAVFLALLSAALFGISTPAAKILLGTVDPAILAGLLYCGAGIGAAAIRRVLRTQLAEGDIAEPTLIRTDMPWLFGAVFAGGVAGPLLLMLGLERTEAATASLLLTLEGVATALLAWFAFHENFDRRVAMGMVCLVAGAVVLAWSGTPTVSDLIGPLAITGACLAWGLDNNLTRKVSLSDPLQIVEIKGLVAGPVNLLVGVAVGGHMPTGLPLVSAGILGFLGYGLSLALFVLALRHLGTARTGAYFSTSPFIGAATAVFMLGEPITMQLVVAGLLMGFGVWLHLTEHHDHDHEHEHEPMEHSHRHSHDEHHQHAHYPNAHIGEPHTHLHQHERLRHSHPHVPDMHHTHRHV